MARDSEQKKKERGEELDYLTAEELLKAMEARSRVALAAVGSALDQYYPCFEKNVQVRLHDVKGRVEDQVIECNVKAYLRKKGG